MQPPLPRCTKRRVTAASPAGAYDERSHFAAYLCVCGTKNHHDFVGSVTSKSMISYTQQRNTGFTYPQKTPHRAVRPQGPYIRVAPAVEVFTVNFSSAPSSRTLEVQLGTHCKIPVFEI